MREDFRTTIEAAIAEFSEDIGISDEEIVETLEAMIAAKRRRMAMLEGEVKAMEARP